MVKSGGRYWVFHCAEPEPLFNFHQPWDGPRSAQLEDPYEMSEGLLAELGTTLVSSVPTDPDKYRKWLHTQRHFYSKWNTLLKRLLCISTDQVNTIESDNPWLGILEEAYDGRMDEDFPTSKLAEESRSYVTTFLTFDLDLEVFSINNKAHYRLSHIPRGDLWIEALRVDDGDNYFVHPSLAPEDSLASIAVENQQFTDEDIELWDSLEKKKVWQKRDMVILVEKLKIY
ncbi:MAG: hypothetical protein Q9180_006819 [Flavoplaca navasiana]